MVKNKYQSVLDLGEKLNVKDGDVSVKEGVLHIKGKTNTQYEKNLLWDEIKRVGGENPNDVKANIVVENTSIYANHTVQKGETLGKIAKHYYGKASKYTEIFEANKNILKDPDTIFPDQELVIPNL